MGLARCAAGRPSWRSARWPDAPTRAPQPLVPEQTLHVLESRSLTDPELLRHIREKTGRAEEATPPPVRWDRAELFIAAMELNPGLAEARAQLEQATAGLKTARTIQNPTLSLATEYDLTRAAEIAVALGHRHELSARHVRGPWASRESRAGGPARCQRGFHRRGLDGEARCARGARLGCDRGAA